VFSKNILKHFAQIVKIKGVIHDLLGIGNILLWITMKNFKVQSFM